MRSTLERSRSARVAAVMLAFGVVVPLVRAAQASGDLSHLSDVLRPELTPERHFVDVPALATASRHRHARRIWAASGSRPLRITLARRLSRSAPHRHLAAARPARPSHAPVRVARVRPAAEAQVVFAKLIVLPKPPQSPVVSIFQDSTLRNGDAVMMRDGIHLYHGLGEWPHRPRDFVRLTFVAALDWHLRKTLDALDRNPPARWSAVEAAAAGPAAG